MPKELDPESSRCFNTELCFFVISPLFFECEAVVFDRHFNYKIIFLKNVENVVTFVVYLCLLKFSSHDFDVCFPYLRFEVTLDMPVKGFKCIGGNE